ncbi:Hypothetical predicted protein [Paramuricea clavata]|uniref:Uncharacterized protein n=1 Tax=Paramuricea clavata TaxID=317549 RepID=A0A6S7JAD8_PARCT|nr:Hypothetical predicted protein [Paramuricea clavata]
MVMAENSVRILQFDPATGKFKVVTKENSDNFAGVDSSTPGLCLAADVKVSHEKEKLSLIKTVESWWRGKTRKEEVAFETLRLSCKSDTYQEGHRYGGVIIYLYKAKSESEWKSDWRTCNNTHCKTGYIVIQDTDSENVKKWIGKEPGKVHGAVYRNAFGESVNDADVVGEGFAFRSNFEIVSRTLNNANDQFHDENETMNKPSAHCVRKIVTEYWKDGGSSYIGHTFKVKDLLWDFKD